MPKKMVPKFSLNKSHNINSILLCKKLSINKKEYKRLDSFSVDTSSESDSINSEKYD